MPRTTPASANAADPLRNKKDDQLVWVENLLAGDSVYRSDRSRDNYPMAPVGFVGSVVAVPVKIAKEAFFRRALSRGKLRLLTDGDAAKREEQLIEKDDRGNESDRILESLEKGASDAGSRYKNKNLPDDGTEGRSISAEQILKKTANVNPGVVRRSSSSAEEEAPIELNVTIEDTVKEGEWTPDVG